MEFAVRKSVQSDLDEIMRVYSSARAFMRAHDNPTQWIGYPTEETVKNDMESSNGYVVTYDGVICGVFAFFTTPDPTYAVIEDGSWLNDAPYGTVHRVASDGKHRGVLAFVMSYCSEMIPNIRIDTHADNYVMQNALTKLGFEKRGIIHLADGSPRIAYQKIFSKLTGGKTNEQRNQTDTDTLRRKQFFNGPADLRASDGKGGRS